ncbi:hypothetical protein [Erwinia mallotivora]|uniref:hypothetical protein n=1 Tax=Erwinia mallotivora TaxID=69222 RepID=UPI0021C1282C|nr:hypothetical protein [Erwinia mallotivora]
MTPARHPGKRRIPAQIYRSPARYRHDRGPRRQENNDLISELLRNAHSDNISFEQRLNNPLRNVINFERDVSKSANFERYF